MKWSGTRLELTLCVILGTLVIVGALSQKPRDKLAHSDCDDPENQPGSFTNKLN